MLVFGARPDLDVLVTSRDFLLTSALALATAGLSSAAALVLAVPAPSARHWSADSRSQSWECGR